MMMCSVIIRAVVGSCPSAHARWERFRARVAQRASRRSPERPLATLTVSESDPARRQGASSPQHDRSWMPDPRTAQLGSFPKGVVVL